MFLSESEIDLRLIELRRRRDLIEREIADLLLYRDLGRRLSASDGGSPAVARVAAPGDETKADQMRERFPADREAGSIPPRPVTKPASDISDISDISGSTAETTASHRTGIGASMGTAAAIPAEPMIHPAAAGRRATAIPPAVAFEDDPVAARRYGRAILEAALEALREAGRPLHAGEVLERVVARGFTVPGQDPVAALNTRLWKRSGPGGPLRRLGEAVYALAEPPAG
ncbi:winged helix-turn-helix domain-containing protein [Methylobacterium sp. sgz302541]|uniref:winged helix-turn-helix domain-containing protein n=1 Tax=unclassified Methylobacterium TaxID=2615210 RepID=UPI003D354E02